MSGRSLLPPFPLNAFPPPLQRYAQEASASVGAPVDHAASAMLAVASSAIGTSHVAVVKRSHVEPCVVWVAIVAGPGMGKSPLLDTVCRPVWARQTQSYADWQQECETVADGEPAPRLQNYVLSDLTVEALPDILIAQPRGVLYYQDEMSAWVASMDQYKQGGKGTDLQSWLKIWSCSPLASARARRGTIVVPRPFVSIVGGVQPEMLAQLATGAGGTLRADGFLDRVMFSYPDAPAFLDTDDELSEQSEADWARTVHWLYQQQPDTNGRSVPLPMTPDALAAFRAWRSSTLQYAAGDAPETVHGRLGKAAGVAARFVLVLQLLNAAHGQGDPQRLELPAVQGGTRLADYFTQHALRAYGQISSSGLENATRRMLEWMKKRGLLEVDARGVQNAQVAGVRKVDDVRQMFQHAVELGWGELGQVTVKGQGGDRQVDGFRRYPGAP